MKFALKLLLFIPLLISGTSFGKTCTSDFACGVGYKCVKDLYKTEGYCAKTINKFGAPTYKMPSLESVGPKMDDSDMCSFNLDCSTGFQCVKKSGQLKGYCMK